MDKRKYTLKKRAETQEETRARIVEATIALHEELGPRNTTISAVAERAGVQRLTVYRHFPDEAALFQACTSGWLARNPPPPIPDAGAPAAPAAALSALYAYYRGTERMWHVAYRDVELVPAMQPPMGAVAEYLDGYAESLLAAWPRRHRPKPLRAVARLSVQFSTWQTLVSGGMRDDDMSRLMTLLIQAAGAGSADSPSKAGR